MRWLPVLLIGWLTFIPFPAHAGVEDARLRLVHFNDDLAAGRDAGLSAEKLEAVARDLVVLAAASLDPGTLEKLPAADLRYLSALWLPIQASLPTATPDLVRFAESAGLASSTWGRDPSSDVFQLLMLLDLVDFNAKGEAELTPETKAAYTRAWEGGAITGRAFSAQAFCAVVPAQVQVPIPDSLIATSLVQGSTFLCLDPTQVPEPGADRPLLRAFRQVAIAPLSAYEEKRHWHRALMELMARQMQRTDAEGAAAGLARTKPLYTLLCHAGIPVSVYKPVVDPPDDDGRRWCHFVGPYEEDLPAQMLFSRESNMSDAMALLALLGKAGVKDFDPLRHMVLVNFDMEEDARGNIIALAGRRHGFMGYLDAFAARRYPNVLRPWKPTEP